VEFKLEKVRFNQIKYLLVDARTNRRSLLNRQQLRQRVHCVDEFAFLTANH